MWYPSPAPRTEGRWIRPDYSWYLEPASDPIDFTAEIRYPSVYRLIAPGIAGTGDSGAVTVATLGLESSVSLPLFFASDYEADITEYGDTRIAIYSRPSQGYIVDSTRRVVEYVFDWMAEHVAPYPYDEFIVIVGGYTEGGALEQPRMILMPEHTATMLSVFQFTLTHEVLHQWFYATVCSNTATDPWMDEAITEYFTLRIDKEVSESAGEGPLERWGWDVSHDAYKRITSYDYLDYLPVTNPGESYHNSREYFSTVYSKGPLVIACLTAHMGREREEAFWREYFAEFQHAVPAPGQFMQLADQYLPFPEGTAQEIMANTAPLDFRIGALENRPRQPASGDTGDSAAQKPQMFDIEITYRCTHPLSLPVDLRVELYDGSTIDTTVAAELGTHQLKLEAASPARGVIIDPEYKYPIDVNYLNNSLVLDDARGVGLRLFSGIAFLLESLFSSLWGF